MLNESLRCLQSVKSLVTTDKKHDTRRKSFAKQRLDEREASSKTELPKHHEYSASLLVVINQIAPDLLVYAIPSLETRIGGAEESIRLASVQILVGFFTSKVDVIESYPTLFTEVLNGQRDVSAEIRAEIATAFGIEGVTKMIMSVAWLLNPSANVSIARATFAKAAVLTSFGQKASGAKRGSSSASSKEGPELRESSIDWERSKSFNGEARGHARPRSSLEPSTIKDVLETRFLKLSWLPDATLHANRSLDETGHRKSARDIEKLIFEQIPFISKDNEANVRAGFRRLTIFISQLSPAISAQLWATARSR
ncbi:hypothetical protein FGB62_139g117 [Gracilaria domingensis]|nr:hypothetical protein FGB62_139g117 [Gracilaria domingensis]